MKSIAERSKSIDQKLPSIKTGASSKLLMSKNTKSTSQDRVPVGERYIDTNAKTYGLAKKQQNHLMELTKRSQPLASVQSLLQKASPLKVIKDYNATAAATGKGSKIIGKSELIQMMLDSNELTKREIHEDLRQP